MLLARLSHVAVASSDPKWTTGHTKFDNKRATISSTSLSVDLRYPALCVRASVYRNDAAVHHDCCGAGNEGDDLGDFSRLRETPKGRQFPLKRRPFAIGRV
jgi:hypothetical protein